MAWAGGATERVGPKWLRSTVIPLLLMSVCPPTVMVMWYTLTALNGSLSQLIELVQSTGLFTTVVGIWGPYALGSPAAWSALGIFAAVELVLMRVLPGKSFSGPVTATGHTPVYRANGVLAFGVTMALYILCAYPLGLIPPTFIYDNFGAILGALNIFSVAFCLMLYLKGRFAPSSSDHGVTDNPIFDYYWGTELYPRVFGWDVKMFTNCRFALMSWTIILLSFAAKQKELYGAVSDSMVVAVVLQAIYVAKFFWWETGYLRSLDIMHDRAGFYICWGCLVWVPGVYTSSTLYLVNHPNHLGWPLATVMLVLGTAFIFINYLADEQRLRVRATNGQTTVWGAKPAIIHARYQTESGESKESILLASGWWGISRHFHYVPEILGALFWTLPALFSNVLPYFYVIFLTVLLTDRALRDDNRCAAKYGDDWQKYCQRVKYRIIPGII